MSDVGGGAERVAMSLLRGYAARGHASWLAVGRRASEDPAILAIPNDAYRSVWARAMRRASGVLTPVAARSERAAFVQNVIAEAVGEPTRWLSRRRGREDFAFPGTWRLLDLPPEPPDIVHCHNLHHGYFDLRALPWLSARVPLVLTLHDAWLLSGHCAHSFDCERWRTGCGHCPDLTIYPAIMRDATRENWLLKRRIFERSRLYVVTPSTWLMRKVEHSMLAPAVREARVLPNGVDLNVFRPGDRSAARARLGLPADAHVLLFAAVGLHSNQWKDYRSLREAVARLGARWSGERLLFVALGGSGPTETIGAAELRLVPYQADLRTVAAYYQAADLYIHPARVDTFPTVVIEALACGTPVVATAVGGIPEQIRPVGGADAPTGVLVRPGDAEALAAAVAALLEDPVRVRELAANAVIDARRRFDLERQIDEHLVWYTHAIEDWPTLPRPRR
jgi:glycosyltransferase involved in cell wall biosynthesis